eukprot:TRINITY_DN17306_c0_g1_i1.p1 TRINITY_DN17306_c0_g1~~TRINITY_DN17306_c0_g1_i1.p1  ORF type:complete len:251 (-),score=17.43 TRINITY_DN17306_c0_g1_i1:8-760(-)
MFQMRARSATIFLLQIRSFKLFPKKLPKLVFLSLYGRTKITETGLSYLLPENGSVTKDLQGLDLNSCTSIKATILKKFLVAYVLKIVCVSQSGLDMPTLQVLLDNSSDVLSILDFTDCEIDPTAAIQALNAANVSTLRRLRLNSPDSGDEIPSVQDRDSLLHRNPNLESVLLHKFSGIENDNAYTPNAKVKLKSLFHVYTDAQKIDMAHLAIDYSYLQVVFLGCATIPPSLFDNKCPLFCLLYTSDAADE